VVVVDDGLAYADAVATHMPEVELVRPDGAACLGDGPAALEWLGRNADRVDVVLLDMQFDVADERLLPLAEGATPRRTRRFQGVAVLREIRRRFPELPVVLLTAVEDLSLVDEAAELAGQSMTYVLDGEDLDALRIRIHGAARDRALGLEESGLLWGRDPKMLAVRRRLAVLARGRLPVILEGETGTGKSYVAERFIHANSGRSGPFVTVDLATIPADLVPAHLFGATRGAYTGSIADRKGVFELAHEGTLFIDEIQNIPAEVQKQLLLVLQDRRVRPLGASREVPVDVKIVAASNTPLAEAVAAGRFRPDLYMRLSPATRVVLPPLRERTADLPFLARRFVARAVEEPETAELRDQVAQAAGLPAGAPLNLVIGRGRRGDGGLELALPDPAWKRLAQHPWPGNVRELATVLQNVVTFTLVAAVDAVRAGLALSSPRLQVDPGLVGELLAGAAPLSGGPTAQPGAIVVRVEPAETLNQVANAVERQYLIQMFQETQGEFGAMAERLLGDAARARAVRLRFNQLGLKVRDLRGR
jgi:DNA-binding NtrC family response regulator